MSVRETKIREEIKKLEANIRWLEQTDRFDRIGVLEYRLEDLKEQLRSVKI